ncbi:MAG: phosphoribosylamine--glycine ligase [Chloroflexi bacterium]|nr:phosphoribosylamine--glycine ligase [Chloroflexota bacterium]
MVNVLVVGSGGREHALCWSLAQSGQLGELSCAPGNAGTAELATNLPIGPEDSDDLVRVAVERRVGLVMVGPEAALAAGLVDRLRERGIPAFGPTAAAARIESSKAWTKELLQRIRVPTARADVVTTLHEARRSLARCSYPVVLKADGLAAGKGVTVAGDADEAEAALDELFVARMVGPAADTVLVEEFLAGRELSVLAFCDGERLALMPPARDYKAAHDGDRGPNTGGMGAYSRPGFASPELMRQVRSQILEPVVAEMAARGHPFVGALYAGLMITPDGPKVLEFNCRFGDPETQVIVPLLESDLLGVAQAVVNGRLDETSVRWRPGSACGVVLASAGYPGPHPLGRPIIGLDGAERDALVFHAGTARTPDGNLVTAGGRVLTVVGVGDQLSEARARAYRAVEAVRFEGRHCRSDIAADESYGD